MQLKRFGRFEKKENVAFTLHSLYIIEVRNSLIEVFYELPKLMSPSNVVCYKWFL